MNTTCSVDVGGVGLGVTAYVGLRVGGEVTALVGSEVGGAVSACLQ